MMRSRLAALGALIMISSTHCNAASVLWNPVEALVVPGETFTVELSGADFRDMFGDQLGVDAGGFNVAWDRSVLTLLDATLSQPPWDGVNVPTDLAGRPRPGSGERVEVEGFWFAVFDPFTTATSPFPLGSLEFQVHPTAAIGGTTFVTLSEYELNPFAADGQVVRDADPNGLAFESLRVTVVPIPGAVWLLLSATGALVPLARPARARA